MKINERPLSGTNNICRAIERGSERSERPSEWARWTSMTFNDALSSSTPIWLPQSWFKLMETLLFKTFVETHSNTIHFKYLFKLIETIYESTRFPFLAKTGLWKGKKTYKNTAKIKKNRSGGSMKTQKTYKNFTKTNTNHSGGRLGVIWAHLGVTWAHLGSSWAHLGSSWVHLGVIWACLGVMLGSS